MKANRFNERGLSLMELVVAMGVGSLALVIIGMLTLFGLRSFVAMGSYTDLDAKSRNALDLMSRDIRQATGVVRYSTNEYSKTLLLTNATRNLSLRYTWDADARTLACAKSGQPETIYLGECDEWNVAFYQRTPLPNQPLTFLPATNSNGTLATNLCKLIALSWKCSRPVPGSPWQTETVQTTQIVLRNQP